MQDGDGVSWPGNISALDTSSPPLLHPSSSPLLSLASQHHPLDSNLLFIYFSPLQALFYLLFILHLVYSFTWKSIYICVCVHRFGFVSSSSSSRASTFLSSTSSKFIRFPCLFFIRGFVSKTWKSICTYMCRFVSSSSSLSLLSLFPLRFHLLFIFSLIYSLFVSKTWKSIYTYIYIYLFLLFLLLFYFFYPSPL